MSDIASPSWPRRFRVPLTAAFVPTGFFVLLQIWERFELLPEALMPLFMLFQLSFVLAVLVISVWFLFFSGFRVGTKLAGVLLVVGAIAVLVGITRRVEFSGRMTPVFVFIWQPDPQADLQERLAHADADPAPGLTAADLVVSAADYPRYRGPAGDGVAAPVTIAGDWSKDPPKELWRTPVGWAYSGIAIAGKVAVTIEQRDDRETIACYDRDTGKERWAYAYPAHFEQSAPMGGSGPRSTPTIADGDVYSMGAQGDLVCLDGTTGKKRWATNAVRDSGAKVVQWGMTGSPLVVGGLVVVNPGIDPDRNQHQAVAAYDRKTGTRAWATGDHPAGYSSPLLATLQGVAQIVLFDGGGLAGVDPAGGRELWRYPWQTFSDMNIIQPLVLPGDRVFISSEATNGCAVLAVKKDGTGWSAAPVWKNRNLAARFANPVYHQGHIYGLHNGVLCCLDAATGRRLWRGERFDSGQLVLTGNTLLVQTERTGELAAVAADPAEYRELGRVRVFQGSRTWNTPSVADGRVYLRNHEEMVCLELPR